MGPVTFGDVVMIQELFQQLSIAAPWVPSSILLVNVMAQDPWELSCPAACWVCSISTDQRWTVGVRALGAHSSWRTWDEIHGASWPPRLQRNNFVFHWTYKKGCWPASPAQDKEGFTLGLSPGQLAPDEVPASVVNGEDLACPVFPVCSWEMGFPLSCMLYKLCSYKGR